MGGSAASFTGAESSFRCVFIHRKMAMRRSGPIVVPAGADVLGDELGMAEHARRTCGAGR